MKKYSEDLKASVIAKMLPPHNIGIPTLAKETNIPINTLYTWRSKHTESGGHRVAENGLKTPSSSEKFHAVLETAVMTEIETSEYCRTHGYYPEQLRTWRQVCEKANAQPISQEEREKTKALSQENKSLQSELRRKEKALAETAALLVLGKKAQAFWEEKDVNLTSQNAAN